jgi:hypothetical protein
MLANISFSFLKMPENDPFFELMHYKFAESVGPVGHHHPLLLR